MKFQNGSLQFIQSHAGLGLIPQPHSICIKSITLANDDR